MITKKKESINVLEVVYFVLDIQARNFPSSGGSQLKTYNPQGKQPFKPLTALAACPWLTALHPQGLSRKSRCSLPAAPKALTGKRLVTLKGRGSQTSVCIGITQKTCNTDYWTSFPEFLIQ